MQQDGLPFDFRDDEMISSADPVAFKHAKSNDFSISKEPRRFVSDALYCGARFIMAGKETGIRAHARTRTRSHASAEDFVEHIVSLCILEAGVQGWRSSNVAVLSRSVRINNSVCMFHLCCLLILWRNYWLGN